MNAAQLQRILYVDDDSDIRAVAQMALETVGGFEVIEHSGGESAVDIAADIKPDLVLLDVMMPGIDGPGLLKLLRARADTAAIPVIFMTAKVQSHEVEIYRAMGALDVIAKPFDPMTLAESVKAIWSRRNV